MKIYLIFVTISIQMLNFKHNSSYVPIPVNGACSKPLKGRKSRNAHSYGSTSYTKNGNSYEKKELHAKCILSSEMDRIK